MKKSVANCNKNDRLRIRGRAVSLDTESKNETHNHTKNIALTLRNRFPSTVHSDVFPSERTCTDMS